MAYPTKENHDYKRYNGHTWIVAIVGMITILIVTIAAFSLLGVALWMSSKDTEGMVFEAIIGVPSIIYGFYKATIQLFTHLTKVPVNQ